jgi:HrpA-like RNA helicase
MDITSDTASLDSIYSLPIADRRAEIIDSVAHNQVTIITAETGAGKSTQVPQYLAEAGYRKVIVTQPRILAARNLSSRVREEYSWRTGSDASNLVGYRTAHEHGDSPENIILYCTDGLQLVRELTGTGTNDRQILILDEIHEWNENMEVLIAWAKKRCAEEPDFKIVLMSATIEANSLATYFGAPPPITVAGRTFPVERHYGSDIVEEITGKLHGTPRNILVFLPGKAEIEQTATAIRSVNGNVPVIPLHSQLEAEVQQRAFEHYPQGKVILSTNIAQTSVTIDDIDVVIDSGLERRAEVRNGVEGLFISEISQADCLQRAGRAGRTKSGTYVLARLDRLPCSPLEARPEYGVPEIMRKHIDRLVLRLANIDMDIESLEFFHAPSKTTIKQAKRTLASLGALSGGEITSIGRRMERFPVESSYSRMLVESEQYPETVRSKLATVIAIQEVGGIVKNGPRFIGWQRYTKQRRSDLLAQYEVLLSIPVIAEEDHDELGIITKNIEKAEEINERLHHELGLVVSEYKPLETVEEEPLLKCVVAGQLHQLWSLESEREAIHIGTKKRRELSSTTVVRHAGLFAGTPFDLEVPTPSGLEVLHLVTDITAVDPTWLAQLAPDTFRTNSGQLYFDGNLGTLARKTTLQYRGAAYETAGTPVLERSPNNQKAFVALYSDVIYQQLEKERLALRQVNFQRIPQIQLRKIQEKVRQLAPGAISTAELARGERIDLIRLCRLETWLGKDFMDGLNTPGSGHHNKHARQGRFKGRLKVWKPKHKRGSRGREGNWRGER